MIDIGLKFVVLISMLIVVFVILVVVLFIMLVRLIGLELLVISRFLGERVCIILLSVLSFLLGVV